MSETPSAEKDAALEARYHVEKINDPTGKHDACRYFVLDPQHDPIAREALRDYAVHALSYGYVGLYTDLDHWLTELGRSGDTRSQAGAGNAFTPRIGVSSVHDRVGVEDGDPWRCAECGSRREVHIAGERDGTVTHAWQPRVIPPESAPTSPSEAS